MRKGQVKGTSLFKQSNNTEVKYVDVFNEFLQKCRIEGKAEETINTYQYHTNYDM